MPERQRKRIQLMQGSLLYRDKRLNGFDAAAVVEVIEHLDRPRLGRYGAGAIRVRPAATRGRHHSESGVQRVVPDAAAGKDAAWRSPFRMDASGVRGVGRVQSVPGSAIK